MSTPEEITAKYAGLLERFRIVFIFSMGAAAILLLAGAIFEAVMHDIASASCLAALFLVTAVLFHLPLLESMKAFSVEIKLRKSIDQAENIISRLRALSAVNAKGIFMSLGWANRLGSPTAQTKQSILAELEKQLEVCGFGLQDRRQMAEQFVRLVGIDLFRTFERTRDRLLEWKLKELNKRVIAEQTDEAGRALINFQDTQTALARDRAALSPYERLQSYNFEESIRNAIPETLLTEDELEKLRAFGNEISALYRECVARGTLSENTARFLDSMQSADQIEGKVCELFGIDDLNS